VCLRCPDSVTETTASGVEKINKQRRYVIVIWCGQAVVPHLKISFFGLYCFRIPHVKRQRTLRNDSIAGGNLTKKAVAFPPRQAKQIETTKSNAKQ
jgi:hypothetical protein